MLQFAIKLLLDDVDVELVSWCGSMYSCFQNFCTNDKVHTNLVFVAELND